MTLTQYKASTLLRNLSTNAFPRNTSGSCTTCVKKVKGLFLGILPQKPVHKINFLNILADAGAPDHQQKGTVSSISSLS